MKILVLSNLYPPDAIGGYEMGCRQAVDALRARGHRVLVLTGAPRTPAPREPHVRRTLGLVDIWDEYARQRSAAVTLHLDEAASHRVNAHNVQILADAIARSRPDVVYAWHLAGVGGLGLMGCLHFLRVPWVWHLMDDVPSMLCKAGGRVVPALAREVGRQLQGDFIACSRLVLDRIAADGVVLRGRTEIIPNWVVGPRPEGRRDPSTAGPLRVATAAAIVDRAYDKGIDLLIEAVARLRAEGREGLTLDVFGDVTDSYYPALIRRRGVTDLVRLRGPRSQAELMGLYGSFDLFAFPGLPFEAFAFAPLEAAAAGCVPLLGDRCGIAEWLVHGLDCLKSPRTVEGFAAALSGVLDRRDILGPIGRRVAALVDREFRLDALIPRIEAVLESASRRPRDGGGTAEDAVRMARIAEKLDRVVIQERMIA